MKAERESAAEFLEVGTAMTRPLLVAEFLQRRLISRVKARFHFMRIILFLIKVT
jgi:hypothetical protein